MKKILLSFIVGILCGVAILYIVLLVSGETVTSIAGIDDELSPIPSLSTSNRYTHKAEGQKIQHIEYLEEDEFKSTEGNKADLYQLPGMCKLTIGIYGETIYSSRTAYFHENRLIYMFETDYRTSYGQFPDQKIPESKRIYQEVVFNPNSQLVQDEFSKLLSKYITQENQKKC
ncbi:hypothetical protein BS636_03710 [Acinetobacter sp. LoGeW2-3]|uniref:hypothetical protein n=1 Tax=Acinetobacter sp. LoGeW2-3 TaxID=1808001 RepID=UPI000C0581D7|nr:hypothetical protein [Acinetobacter sp. LoGeW2-3]ATO18833.1 hypothetical protein BS636_03710 [Acinetobacter sp. LoGeW2-3]